MTNRQTTRSRRTRRVLVSLLLGLLSTLIISLAGAIFPRTWFGSTRVGAVTSLEIGHLSILHESWILGESMHSSGWDVPRTYIVAPVVPDQPTWSLIHSSTPADPIDYLREDAVGWPCRAFAVGYARGHASELARRPGLSLRRADAPPVRELLGFPGDPARTNDTILPWQPALASIPLSPIWFGIVVDTITFAAAWWLVLAGFGVWRRRAWVGTPCGQCGYNLHGLTTTVCPECGTAISAAS